MPGSHTQESAQPRDLLVPLPGGGLFTRTWSDGKSAACPIVLLHDSLGCAELWRDFPAELSRQLRRDVIAYDRLGYGRSEASPGRLADDHIETEPASLARLLDALGIGDFIACGHSIGGEMAVACGSRQPDRCRAVIAIAAQTWIEEQTLSSIAGAREQFSDPEQLQRLAKYHGVKAEWVLSAWTETWFRPSMRDWSICPELPLLHCPLLVIHGDHDEFASLEQPRRMVALAGGPARLAILEDCGHLPHREQPQTVLDLIEEFLAEYRL